MALYAILILLGLVALGVLVLAVFMFMDASQEKDDFASKVTRAVDATANANGLWTRKLRRRAVVFLFSCVLLTIIAVYVLQHYGRSSWEW